MSLFPCVPDEPTNQINKDENWLVNPSFNDAPLVILTANTVTTIETVNVFEQSKTHPPPPIKSKEKRKKSKKDDRNRILLTGDEDFYIDNKSEKIYLTVLTLARPACPKYYSYSKMIGRRKYIFKRSNHKRYFTKKLLKIHSENNTFMSDLEILSTIKSFNSHLNHHLNDVDKWIEFVEYQEIALQQSTATEIADKKVQILERALADNKNDRLLKIYTKLIERIHPADEVSRMVEKMIEKDPSNVILWSSLIQTNRGSMTLCSVPNILELYGKCMEKLFKKQRSDEIMLKFFYSCGLYMRQSGSYEQFFSLIKLALNLNVTTESFNKLYAQEKTQNSLIEYEEVVLSSGLPMHEIWLRIEKLRQNFNFLPCPENVTCNDPQRIIFNEDICKFIYPLTNNENSFQLILLILKLLKIPILSSNLDNFCLFEKNDFTEFDSIEEILVTFLSNSFHKNSNNFNLQIFEIIKELNIGPSFILSNVGYEIYLESISDLCLSFSEFFQSIKKKTILMLIWIRFERILFMMDRLAGKINELRKKEIKQKIKTIFKSENFRNNVVLYVDYALYEYELGNIEMSKNILQTSINVNKEIEKKFDLCYSASNFVEILMKENNLTEALKILTGFFLNLDTSSGNIEISEKINSLVARKIDEVLSKYKNLEDLELENYFIPDEYVHLIKLKIYHKLLTTTDLETFAEIEKLLKQFKENNRRNCLIKEHLYEIYLNIISFDKINNQFTFDVLSRGLIEFPNNLFILKFCAMMDGQSWDKIRKLLTTTVNTPYSILFLILSAKLRMYNHENIIHEINNPFVNLSTNNNEENIFAYRNRITNILKYATGTEALTRKNSLIWRLYLKNLVLHKTDPEKCKHILYAALDECPWNKALYLDGVVCTPQELPQLMDLILEKQIRLYALLEELEILRSDN